MLLCYYYCCILRFGTSHAVVAVCTTAAAVFCGQIITGGNMADRSATPERGEFVVLSSAPAPSGRNSCLGPFPPLSTFSPRGLFTVSPTWRPTEQELARTLGVLDVDEWKERFNVKNTHTERALLLNKTAS